MKTAEQVARETLGADALAGIGYDQYVPYMTRAIEADRAQRDIYELIAAALDEREELSGDGEARMAADAIRSEHEDDIWTEFIGPMLDQMEERYGR